MLPPRVEYPYLSEYSEEDFRTLQKDALRSRKIPAHCTECGAWFGNLEPDGQGATCDCGGEVKSVLVIEGLI